MNGINSDDILSKISYQYFIENRYIISELQIESLDYSAICNNGWIKLHTTKGKAYWLSQNEMGHLSPDWKFHVSVVHEDIPKAWNIVSKLFLEMRCRSGMKVSYLKENQTTAKGREITIYIFKYIPEYSQKSEIAKDYLLNYADEHSEDFWFKFFQKIEESLSIEKIRSNGLAKGDKKLGNYVSIRNEAYIKIKNKDNLDIDEYPPDSCGWNASGHSLPFDLNRFEKNCILYWKPLHYILISFLILIISYISVK